MKHPRLRLPGRQGTRDFTDIGTGARVGETNLGIILRHGIASLLVTRVDAVPFHVGPDVYRPPSPVTASLQPRA
jgi:hypothetical protein